jgi:hypothetical protein
MDDPAKAIRERMAGYAEFNKWELEQHRSKTAEDRGRDLMLLLNVAHYWDSPNRDDSQFWERWANVKTLYEQSQS